MIKTFLAAVIFTVLLLSPVMQAAAQTSADSSTAMNTSSLPQWVKDMRRWDIIAFGSFPFAMFTVTFITDMVRWNDANGLDFSEEGRRYAPWPLKSAGGVEMTKEEYERTILYAALLSMTIAITDLIIVKIKQHRERRRIESRGEGTYTINKKPIGAEEESEEAAASDENAVDGAETE